MSSAFIFKEIANLSNVKPETAGTGPFLLLSPDVSSHPHPVQLGAPAVHPVATGLVESGGISHSKAQPEQSAEGVKGNPSFAVTC